MANPVSCVALWLLVSPGIDPRPALPPAPRSLVALSREVEALRTLYALRLTRGQLEHLRELAPETVARPPADDTVEVSAALRKTLGELREALARADDDDRIGKLYDRYDELLSDEDAPLEGPVEYTEEAAEQAPSVLDMLTPAQVAGYLGGIADEVADPRQVVLEALAKARGVPAAEWAEARDAVASQVSRLAAGLDDDKARRIHDQVAQLLIVARGLREEEFKRERSSLEQKGLQIVTDAGPAEVLRHVMEEALAELLSNPRLPAALNARLRK